MLNYFIRRHPHVSVFMLGILFLALGLYLLSGEFANALITIGIGIIISSIALSAEKAAEKNIKGW